MAKKKYVDPEMKCIITGRPGVDLHHVKSRSAGGTDDAWNLLPIGHSFHVKVHEIGLKAFADRYPEACQWLIDNDWTICPYLKKWVHNSKDL